MHIDENKFNIDCGAKFERCSILSTIMKDRDGVVLVKVWTYEVLKFNFIEEIMV